MNKIIEYENLPTILSALRSEKIVLVGGCFDILHEGHIQFLKKAKEEGGILFILLENDESVRSRKGEKRPIHTQKTRAAILSSLSDVDYILLLPHLKTDLEYYDLVKKIEPDIIAVTESDPAYNKKKEQAKMVGGRVVKVIQHLPEHSTTNLSERITQS